MIDRELSFWFLLVVTGLFAFCADDVIATSKEVKTSTDTTSKSKKAKRGKLVELRIRLFLS
jgi:hypothetical protein